jgi:hypothetical protein
LCGTDDIRIYLTFRLFPSHFFLLYVITLTIFCGQFVLLSSYLRKFFRSPFTDNTTNLFPFPLSLHTNIHEYKGNRNNFTLTINKEAESRLCGLHSRNESKIAMCQQVYSLLTVINISCNESEIAMADLRLCISSPGNNFVQLCVCGGGTWISYKGLPRIGLRFEPHAFVTCSGMEMSALRFNTQLCFVLTCLLLKMTFGLSYFSKLFVWPT